jgi:CarD family transcriptional regulator
MQFRVGDRVVHPIHGVGVVKTFSKQQGSGVDEHDYYQVTTGSATVWVPINAEGFAGLRKIAPKESLPECRKLLKGRPVPLEKNRQLRQLEIAKRLKGSLLPELCGMVRDLRARSRDKPLGITEDNLLRKIYKALGDEWAAVDGVPTQTALHEIESLLQEGNLTTTSALPASPPTRTRTSQLP